MPQRVIHVGIGVFGRRWCREFLERNVEDGTDEVLALVDLDPRALAYGAEELGLDRGRCYTDAAVADAPCRTVCATTWRPDWAAYAGDTDARVTLVFENGVRASYEGSATAAAGLNDSTGNICASMANLVRRS